MKTARLASLALCIPSLLLGQAATQPARHESLRQEISLSYERGLNWLRRQQNPQTGQWGDAEPVAFTALAVSSFLLTPGRKPMDPVPAEAQRGINFLLSQVKPDGGIYIKARANYNTSLALTALMMAPPVKEREGILLAARRFIIGQQNDFDEKGKSDNPFDGGVGYGTPKPGKPAHADLSNTHFALEALYFSQALLADKGDAGKNEPQLNFSAAIEFIKNCQNMPQNKASWVSDDPKDKGGFIYSPGETRGGETKTKDGRVALRSYGSISYAGLLSFIYAGLDKGDPSVKAVLQWLSENYTLDENPGLGNQGKFYYFHTMAKALATAKIDYLKTKDGKQVDWRVDLGQRLLSQQGGDGSWANSEGRWMESDAVLCTSYILMALARVHNQL